MPTSDPALITPICQRILELNPSSVLDIGAGHGKWGFLAREYTDIYWRKERQTRIDGIEIHEPLAQALPGDYDHIYTGNVLDILPTLGHYDLIIAADVIEHLSKENGLTFLRLAQVHSNVAIVTTPIKFFNQGEIFGNPHEAHLSHWSYEELAQFGEVSQARVCHILETACHTLHFICTGDDFPYQYYLSVLTAIKTQNAKVKLWLMQDVQSKYIDLLDIEIGKVDPLDFPALKNRDDGFIRSISKDYTMWRILYEQGGFCFDLDTISLGDITSAIEDKEVLACRDRPDDSDWWAPWNSSIVGATKGSVIVADVFEQCNAQLQDPDMRWGETGPMPFCRAIKKHPDRAQCLPFRVGGGIEGNEIDLLYSPGAVWPEAKVLHLYASADRFIPGERRFHSIDPKFVHTSDSRLATAIRSVLSKSEYDPLGEIDTMPKSKPSHRKFTFHLLTLAHLPQSSDVMACAFSQKNRKMARMLTSLGHQVYAYCSEGSDIAEYCDSDNLIQIETHKLTDIRQDYGDGDNRFFCGYDYKKSGWRHDFNSARKPSTLKYNAACIEHINKIKRPDDFLLVMQGVYHKPIADAVNLWLTCEPGIGYRGSFARFRAFESAYLQNFTYGSQHPGKCINGNYYDRTIPNYFDAKDFPFRAEKEDWFFFMGRMIPRKGVWTAIKATEAIGAKLVLAGQTSPELDVSKLPPHCEFIGYVEPEQRADLMGRAKAVFVPTLYLEAFGGVNVEAQLCGTPAITTNFSVFPETVLDGTTGFRCNTLDDFVWACRHAGDLDPHVIRQWAEQYLMENVKWQFERWFCDLYDLYESAADSTKKGWHRIRDHEPRWRQPLYSSAKVE